MAGDDNENEKQRLPSRVERALAAVRTAAKADRERRAGRWLAAVPLAIGALLLALMMPRAAAPSAIPLPRIDERVLRRVAAADDALAAAAEQQRLPTDVLAVGGAIRNLNGAEARKADEAETFDARRQLEATRRDLFTSARDPKAVITDLASLRALQTRHFLDAIERWEKTGDETSADFVDLAAAFVARSRDAGWITNRRMLLSDVQRRAAFKTVWNALAGFDERPELALEIDEQRALYAFYILHPHPSESQRLVLEQARRAATTPETCAAAERDYRRHAELWRAEKIKKLGTVDPTYPTKYALGVAYFRAGRHDLSTEAFASFVSASPDGPYALRAKNHLQAALTANGPL